MPLPRRSFLLLASVAIALVLLYPGVTRPVLTLSGTIEKADLVDLGINLLAGEEGDSGKRRVVSVLSMLLGFDQVSGDMPVYHETRSILGTAQELARTGNGAVALLIVLFSIVVPLFKLTLQLLTLLPSFVIRRRTLDRVIAAVSKWSMTDVFVMALIVTYLAGSASGQLGDLMRLDASFEPGFYYFLGYCLFSIASTLLVEGVTEGSPAPEAVT